MSSDKLESTEQVAPVLTGELAHWLGQLTLLYGLPVEYMVPDVRLLPVESIRFFYIDRNWLDRLVDGAMSVGVLSSKEKVFNQAFFQDIYQQVDAAQLNLRNKIRSAQLADVKATGGTMTGLLFRSQVVTAYPGVEIHPYDKDNNPLNILRMDRLSNSLIFCIFDGIPEQVDFIQPSEGLHFGITRQVNDTHVFSLQIRGLGFPSNKPEKEGGYPAGAQIHIPPGSENYVKIDDGVILKDASEGVIDITALVKSIETKMNGLIPPALEGGKLTPGGLAIQFVVGSGFQSYKIKDDNGNILEPCEYNYVA